MILFKRNVRVKKFHLKTIANWNRLLFFRNFLFQSFLTLCSTERNRLHRQWPRHNIRSFQFVLLSFRQIECLFMRINKGKQFYYTLTCSASKHLFQSIVVLWHTSKIYRNNTEDGFLLCGRSCDCFGLDIILSYIHLILSGKKVEIKRK